MDYVDLVVKFVVSEQPRAYQVLLKLLEQYHLESKSRFTHHNHVFQVLTMMRILNADGDVDVRLGQVFVYLNDIPLRQLKSTGHFASLLQTFFGVYPHFIAKLNPTFVEHIKIKPYLMTPNIDVEAATSILASQRNHDLEMMAAETLTDLLPVAAVREQININDILLTTTNITSIVKLLQIAPQNFKPEIIEKLIMIINNTSSQSANTVLNFPSVKLGNLIGELANHISFMKRDVKNTAIAVLMQIFSKQDKTLSLIAAEALQKITATLSVEQQTEIGIGLQSMVSQYSLTPGSVEPYTVIIIIIKFYPILISKMLNLNALINLYMTNGVLFEGELSMIDHIPAMIEALSPDEKFAIYNLLTKDMSSSNPKIELQLIILSNSYAVLPSSIKIKTLQCFYKQFAEYKHLSTEEGINDICGIYKSLLSHIGKIAEDQEVKHLHHEINSTLLILLERSKKVEIATALISTLLMIKTLNTDNKRIIEINYLTSLANDTKYICYVRIAACNLLAVYPDINSPELDVIVKAVLFCVTSDSIQLKLAGLIAFTAIADKIPADPHERIYIEIDKNLNHAEILVKAQAVRALGKISRFIPENQKEVLIDSLIFQAKQNVIKEYDDALQDALGDFAPDIKDDSDSRDSSEENLLGYLIDVLSNCQEDANANCTALLIKLAPTMSDTLMHKTLGRLQTLSQTSTLKVRVLAMQALTGILPACKPAIKDKLVIELQWGLCDRYQAKITETGLKSVTPSNNVIDAQINFIFTHLFVEKTTECATALQNTLLHYTQDCSASTMLHVIKNLFAAIESNNPQSRVIARHSLLKLADNMIAKPKYDELKSFFICKYLLAQQNKTITREAYFTYATIVARFVLATKTQALQAQKTQENGHAPARPTQLQYN